MALHPDGAGHGVAPRPGVGVVETVAARQVPGGLLGDEEGLVREALPGERLGPLLGVPRQQVAQKIERYAETAGTAVSPGQACARLAGSLRRTWPSTRTAPVTGSPLGQARAWWRPWRRGRNLVGAAGRRRGVCPVPERLGLMLGAPRQQVAPGRVAEGAGQGPCGDPAATEGERVVEGATAERQVRGAVDPAHPHGARSVGSLFPLVPDGAEPGAHRETLSADPCVSWCECVALIRHLVNLQEACDAKANHRGRGVMNAMDGVEKQKGARKSRKYRSYLAWMTAVRDQVAVVETDNMADPVQSQGGTTIANLKRCQHEVGSLGRRYSSARGTALQQPGSGLCAASCYRGFRRGERHDESRGAGRAQDGTPLLAAVTRVEQLVRLRRPHHGVRGRLGVAHGSAVPDNEHAESARWSRALSMESRLLRWIACSDLGLLHDRFIEAKKPWPENSTFVCWWQAIVDRELLCVEEVARASTSSHLSCHFGGFMVHKDVPPVTSSQQFLDDLATHLRSTTEFTIPFDLKEHFSLTQLLVRVAQQTHRVVPLPPPRGGGRPWRGSGAGPLCHGAGVHDGLVVGGSPRREGGAWSGGRLHCAGLARVNDGVPLNAFVMRPEVGFEVPKDAGSTLILTVMQDPGVVCPCFGCRFKL